MNEIERDTWVCISISIYVYDRCLMLNNSLHVGGKQTIFLFFSESHMNGNEKYNSLHKIFKIKLLFTKELVLCNFPIFYKALLRPYNKQENVKYNNVQCNLVKVLIKY